MIDHHVLAELVPILKQNGVKHFKAEGLEIEFDSGGISGGGQQKIELPKEKDQSVELIADALRKQEQALPIDLRADTLMDQDKILNWSSPDQKPFEEDNELPLTGEQPL